MMHKPNPATTPIKILPWFFLNGMKESVTIIIIEPISDAALRSPKPSAPTFKISLAKTGIMATAPPKSTANISKHNAPRISFVL